MSNECQFLMLEDLVASKHVHNATRGQNDSTMIHQNTNPLNKSVPPKTDPNSTTKTAGKSLFSRNKQTPRTGKSLWNKFQLKSSLLFVTKKGFRNELYKLTVLGARKTGKTLLCSHVVGCQPVMNSQSTDADDIKHLDLRRTLFDNQEHNIVLYDQLLDEDSIVTVVHQDHPPKKIGYELSNGRAVNRGAAVKAARLHLHDHDGNKDAEAQIRTATSTFVTQINVQSQFGLKNCVQLKHVNSGEDSDSDQDMHDADGNYIGGGVKTNKKKDAVQKVPTMYGIQLLDTPPCLRTPFNKRGVRIIQDEASQVAYDAIASLGVVPSKTSLLGQAPPSYKYSDGSDTTANNSEMEDDYYNYGRDSERKHSNATQPTLRMKKKNIPKPGSSTVTHHENNLLWRNCVAGSAVIMYNIMKPNSFKVAKDMLQAIRDRQGTRNVPILVIGNYADLANHTEYDFDRDCEITHQYRAFYAYGSMLENRLIHQGKECTVVQLIHRLVLTMRTSGLLLHGKPHSNTPHPGANNTTRTDVDIHALVAKYTKASEDKKIIDRTDNEDEKETGGGGGWFGGWCGGRV